MFFWIIELASFHKTQFIWKKYIQEHANSHPRQLHFGPWGFGNPQLGTADLEKTFDRLPWNKEIRFTRDNGESIDEPLWWSIGGGTELLEEFYVEVGVHQGSVLPLFVFAVVLNEIIASGREGLLKEILYADELVLLSETMEELKKFGNGKRHLRTKG